MSLRPPVTAALLPSVRATRVIALLAFALIAVIGARAVIPSMTISVSLVLIVCALASVLLAARPEDRWIAIDYARVLAGIPSFAIIYSALSVNLLRPLPAVVVAVAGGMVAGATFGATVRACANARLDALDAKAVPAAHLGLWLAIAALLARFGSHTAHLHDLFPALSLAIAALSAVVTLRALTTLVRQRRWTERVYANQARPLGVGPMPPQLDIDLVPRLSVGNADLVITVDPAQVGAYRGERSAVARAPSSPERLLGRYTRGVRVAAAGCAVSLVGVCAWPFPSAAHSAELASVPKVLPELRCPGVPRWPTLRLVALAPLELVDIEEVAARYRRAGLPDVRVEPPLPFEARFLDKRRSQVEGEDIARAAARAYPPRNPKLPWNRDEIVLVLTDRDMFVSGMPWQYAFAAEDQGAVVISLARMDPAFPLIATESYVPRRPSCAAVLHERAYKMITRRILDRTCFSVSTLLGLAALDSSDEGEGLPWGRAM